MGLELGTVGNCQKRDETPMDTGERDASTHASLDLKGLFPWRKGYLSKDTFLDLTFGSTISSRVLPLPEEVEEEAMQVHFPTGLGSDQLALCLVGSFLCDQRPPPSSEQEKHATKEKPARKKRQDPSRVPAPAEQQLTLFS